MQAAESRVDVSVLQDTQVASFDEDYVCEAEWQILQAGLREHLGDRWFRFLDVGGGNGKFGDRLLAAYPRATGVILDNAKQLLGRNTPNPRKSLVEGSALDLKRHFGAERFDLIVFNWVLHHMVTPEYRRTRALQARVLAQAGGLLNPGGIISISENLYEGLLMKSLPGKLIYGLTSTARLAPVTSRLGANTAGVGVCFLTQGEIQEDAFRAGLDFIRFQKGYPKRMSLARRALLQVRAAHHGHFLFGSTVRGD